MLRKGSIMLCNGTDLEPDFTKSRKYIVDSIEKGGNRIRIFNNKNLSFGCTKGIYLEDFTEIIYFLDTSYRRLRSLFIKELL